MCGIEFLDEDDQEERQPLTWSERLIFHAILLVSAAIGVGVIWFGVIHIYRLFE